MILKKLLLVVLFQFTFLKAFCQLEQYYHKIEQVAYTEKSADHLFKRIDSIKQTRRPNDSKVSIYFNRNIDFGYKQQRINITFNGLNLYSVNLLTKNDVIIFCSVLYGNSEIQENEQKRNLKQNHPKIDTAQAIKYLSLRNKFYTSSKKIGDLTRELNLNKVYAFYCGDGNLITEEAKTIEAIVKENDISKLKVMLRSISCEEQAYGVDGIRMLQKNKVTIPVGIKKLADYIDNRNSELVTCEGCSAGLIKPIHNSN